MKNARRTRKSVNAQKNPRVARGSLSAEAILDAAEGVAAGAPDQLTVRAVASALSASPMSLYRYFDTKDELVEALLDRVLGRYVPVAPTARWADDLVSFGRAHRRVLVDHPWAVTAFFNHASPGVNATRIGEDALAILARGGVTGAAAVAAFSSVVALNYGWCGFALARREDCGALEASLAGLPTDQFPLTVSVAQAMADCGSDDHYEAALGSLVRGIAATLAHRDDA